MAALLLTGGLARAQEEDARPPVPEYRVPDGLEPAKLPDRLAAALDQALRTLADAASPEDAQDAARLVAGLGPAALPAVTGALRTPQWAVRVRLVSSIAEMDAPEATPVLLAAAGDPAFGVREAALLGLGKTGDERSASILGDVEALAAEPVWRVRAAAATAIRRSVLRGKLDAGRGGAVLLRLLADPDRDVRLVALEEAGQLAAPEVLPHLLELFGLFYGDGASAAPADERRLVLSALRGYRDTRDERLTAALVRGFSTAEPKLAVEAGRTLFDLVGAGVLEDPIVSDAVLRHLVDSEDWRMREAVGSLGRGAAPWLAQQARDTAHRIAFGRGFGREGQLEHLVDLLVKVDPDRGVALLRSFMTGPEADGYTPDTRRLALERASTSLASRLAAELRALFRSPLGRDLRVRTLRAIVKSGGDDVDVFLAEALEHEEKRVVMEAIDLVSRRPQTDLTGRLAELAETAEFASVRRLALETVARRDHERAAELAEGALDASDRELRRKAISILGDRIDARRFALLLERFHKNDAPRPGPVEAPAGSDGSDGDEPAVTSSDLAARLVRTRQELLRALGGAGGELAIPVLFETLETAASAALRRGAAQELRDLVGAEHAARLVGRAVEETDTTVQEAILVTLASLVEAPESVGHFDGLLAHPTTRHGALVVLTQARHPVAPPALEVGLLDKDWTHEDKEIALRVLSASGVLPARETLVELVRSTRHEPLVAEGIHLLTRHGEEVARKELLALLATFDDRTKRVFVVQALGRTRAPEAAPALRELLFDSRAEATAAPVRNPAVDLYEACAIALALCGDHEEVGPLLVRELLHPTLVHAGARLSVPHDGPFRDKRSPTVLVITALVRALAHVDDAALRRIFETELERLALDGRDLMLEEGYVDGVARYLRDPVAYGLPARRRPAAGLALRRLVPRIAPRLSGLDVEAYAAISEQFVAERRLAEGRDAWARAIELNDVEDASRSTEKRLWESGKLRVLEARALAAAGDQDAALEALGTVRSADPSSDELAYLHGLGLAKIGRSGPEARDALLFARAQNPKYPSATFYLGWVTEVMDGPERALAHYEKAEELDLAAVENAGNQYKLSRKGKLHPWSYYPYYSARALARLGRLDEAADKLYLSIRLDDREAGRARADAAFGGWEDLDLLLEDALSRIPD